MRDRGRSAAASVPSPRPASPIAHRMRSYPGSI